MIDLTDFNDEEKLGKGKDMVDPEVQALTEKVNVHLEKTGLAW